MSDCLSESEKEALKEFKRELLLGSHRIGDRESIKFLAARKFNVQRALELFVSHQNTRDKEDLLNIDVWDEEVRRELVGGKLTVFSEKDHEGATILLLTARLHHPHLTNHRAVLKGLVVQLDCALESLEAQRKGVTLIYDMTDSKFNNFDYELSKKILNMLKGSYPARLKKVLIVMAPLWFKAPFKVLRHFILEKLRNRVHVIHSVDLLNHLPATSVPTHLGGTLPLDHRGWITRCLTSTACHDHVKPHLLPPIPDRDVASGFLDPRTGVAGERLDAYFSGAPEDLPPAGSGRPSAARTGADEEPTDASRPPPAFSSTSSSSTTCPRTLTDSCLETDEEEEVDDEEKEEEEDDEEEVECNMDDDVLYIDLGKDGISESKNETASQNGSTGRKRTASVSETTEPPKRRPSFERGGGVDQVSSTNGVTAFNDDDLSFTDESASEDESPAIMEQETVLHIPGQSLTPTQIFHYWMAVGHKGLRDEYFNLASEQQNASFHHCKLKVNRHRNRYLDIPCLDETRVRLLSPSRDGSDYVNANFVDSYDKQKGYILTQGPLQKTTDEFWQMVWEQAVLVIVMTTRTLERGRIKCDQYWPPETNQVERHDRFNVFNSGCEEGEECVVTTLVLQNLETMETRETKHVYFLGWPDHGTPESGDSFLDLLDLVRGLQEEQERKFSGAQVPGSGQPTVHARHPLLVHCSAGIGRTGTFVALDILTRSLKDTGRADVTGTIRKLRNQRALSIQTPDQYLFCYEALLCYAKRIGLFSYGDDDDDDGDDDNDEDAD